MTGDRRQALTLGGFAVVLAIAIVALLRWQLWSSGVPGLENGDLEGLFDPVQLAADEGYQAGLRAIAVMDVPLRLLVLVILAVTVGGWTAWLLRLSRSRLAIAAPLVGAAIAALTGIAGWPIDAARFAWVKSHGVGRQDTFSWAVDQMEALLINAVVFGAATGLLALGVYYLPRVWWLALGGIIALLTVLVVVVSPVLFAPRFENTAPLQDAALLKDVEDLSERAGVSVDEVLVSDASRRTRALNARVEGLGATRRVVLFDNLVEQAPREEARWVVAHELAHAKHGHVSKGVAWMVALALPLALLVYAITGAITGFSAGGRPDAETTLARTAVALVSVFVLLTLTAPLQNAISRAYEAEADWTALKLTGEPEAAIDFRERSLTLRRGDPEPPRPIYLWFGTHPTTSERIGLAQRFAREGAGGS